MASIIGFNIPAEPEYEDLEKMAKKMAAIVTVNAGLFEDMLGVPSYADRDFMVNEITGASGEDRTLVREGEVGKVEFMPGRDKLSIVKNDEVWVSVKFPSQEFVWFFPIDSLSDPEEKKDAK